VRRDAGSIAPAVPAIALILLLLGGLVLDASRLLNLRGRALAYAEEAARAGAGALELRPDGFLRVDPLAAEARVEEYCTVARDGGSVSECEFLGVEAPGGTDTRPLAVRVRVRMSENATLLGIVGVSELTATGEARARPVEGTDDQDRDSPPEGVALPEPVDVDPIPIQGPDPGPLPLCDPREPAVPCTTPSGVCEDNANADDCIPRCPQGEPGQPRPADPDNPCAPPCPPGEEPPANRPWACSVFAYGSEAAEPPGGENDT
jgi:Putative Flp pilus-assembly TadE/G-like